VDLGASREVGEPVLKLLRPRQPGLSVLAMLLLSDCPERLAGLARVEGGSEVGVESLSQTTGLVAGVGTGRRLWRGSARDPGPRVLVAALIVAEAPSSQFDALRVSLADGLELRPDRLRSPDGPGLPRPAGPAVGVRAATST